MLESNRADIGIGSRAVVVCEAVEIAALDLRRRIVDEGNAVVRQIVFHLFVIAQCQARRRIDAYRERRRDSVEW